VHLHAFLAFVVLAGSLAIARAPTVRPVALGAAVIAAAEAAIAMGYLAIRVSHVAGIGWVGIAVLDFLMFRKQATRGGGAICGAILAVSAIPILTWAGVLR
jgi:hypothetical protein